MTYVTFAAEGDLIRSVDVRGHSGFAEEGEDIVCAAITSAVMLTHALLFDVQCIQIDTLIEDEGAHIRFTLPPDQLPFGQDAFRALRLHFTELEENYADFLKVIEVGIEPDTPS